MIETIPKWPGLTFDPEAHVYRMNGKRVPNVTTILSDLHLVDHSHVPESARERGTAVHAAIHYWLEGDLDESSLTDEIAPYFRAAIAFLEDSKAKIGGSEIRVYHPEARYAGTLDALGEFFGDPGIADWKSGALGETIGLQTAAYDLALGGPPRRRFGVQLRDDGTYRLADLSKRPEAARDRARFLAAVDLHRTFIFKEAA
jgi:hypothetical protein